MELKNITYLFSVLLFLEIQKCINTLHLSPAPFSCCGPSAFPDYTDQNVFSNYPNYNPFLLGSELDPFTTGIQSFGLAIPSPFANNEETDPAALKAYGCSLLPCLSEDTVTPACACNYNTGNVVTFKNSCDVEKHNCRFDTNFNIILNEICPWEFQSRRNEEDIEIDYSNPKYYN